MGNGHGMPIHPRYSLFSLHILDEWRVEGGISIPFSDLLQIYLSTCTTADEIHSCVSRLVLFTVQLQITIGSNWYHWPRTITSIDFSFWFETTHRSRNCMGCKVQFLQQILIVSCFRNFFKIWLVLCLDLFKT